MEQLESLGQLGSSKFSRFKSISFKFCPFMLLPLEILQRARQEGGRGLHFIVLPLFQVSSVSVCVDFYDPNGACSTPDPLPVLSCANPSVFLVPCRKF